MSPNLLCRLQLDSCPDQARAPIHVHAAHLLGDGLLRRLFSQAPPPQQQHHNQDEYAQHHSCHHPHNDANYLAGVAAAACKKGSVLWLHAQSGVEAEVTAQLGASMLETRTVLMVYLYLYSAHR